MALDPQFRQIFDHHLRSKITKNMDCFVCGSSDWKDGELKGLPVIEKINNDSVKETEVAAHVSLTCPNCGFVLLFSAQVVGLVGVGDQPSHVSQVHVPGDELGEAVGDRDDRLAEVVVGHARGSP